MQYKIGEWYRWSKKQRIECPGGMYLLTGRIFCPGRYGGGKGCDKCQGYVIGVGINGKACPSGSIPVKKRRENEIHRVS
jgi:hypothetical protein